MDLIRIFLQNKRRYISNFSKVSQKTQKRKTGIILKFLFFCKKEKKIKHFCEITEKVLDEYFKNLKEKGAWNSLRKKYEKISEKTQVDHIYAIKNFYQKIKIESR